MNKTSKHKNSCKAIKSSRNLTIKEANNLTSRTPRNGIKPLELKKGNMQKFKSIPTITYRDAETTQIPTENLICQSYVGQIDQIQATYQTEPRLLYSVSDRHNSGSKISLHSKLPHSSKRTDMTSKNKSNYTMLSHRASTKFEIVLQKTWVILEQYRSRQQNWKKERVMLIRELQKYRSKQKKRKNSITAPRSKNIRST